MGTRTLVAGEPLVDLLPGQPEVGQRVPVHRPPATRAARAARATRAAAPPGGPLATARIASAAAPVSARPSQAYTRSIVPIGSATNAS